MSYQRRVMDDELDELLPGLAAIALDGPKGVGKTATAERRARTTLALDDPAVRAIVSADPGRVGHQPPPVLIDEWQHVPSTWDTVRRAVDAGAAPGSFLLTGSATPPAEGPAHSGAGRIVSLRMRPMAFCERSLERPTVGLSDLLSGNQQQVDGVTAVALEDYAKEIERSGFPGIRRLPTARGRRAQLDGYLTRVFERDLSEQGVTLRRPASLRAWLTAYARAESSTASYEAIRAEATPGDADPPTKVTTIRYRDWLTALWLLDPLPAWRPARSLGPLTSSPKHHLSDPALAARAQHLTSAGLLRGAGRPLAPADRSTLGSLFESLATLTVRVLAQATAAHTWHLRTHRGAHEVDLVVEGDNGAVLAVEVKLSSTVNDRDVRHLTWLRDALGEDLVDAVVINTGSSAYRRRDGVAVVPLALLGP